MYSSIGVQNTFRVACIWVHPLIFLYSTGVDFLECAFEHHVPSGRGEYLEIVAHIDLWCDRFGQGCSIQAQAFAKGD
jgi:hypothetical protein